MLIAEDIQVEWEENGCYLLVDGERWRVADPEQLYDRVKAAVLPWLMERDEARRVPYVFRCDPDESGGYAADDPKSEGYHDRMSALSDDRDAFAFFSEEDR